MGLVKGVSVVGAWIERMKHNQRGNARLLYCLLRSRAIESWHLRGRGKLSRG